MISYAVYKMIHFAGILMIFTALGGSILNATPPHPARKLIAATHGAGLLLALLGGFGALAQLGAGFPGWVMAKLVIWFFLGAALLLATRQPRLAIPLWWPTLLAGSIAAALAITKPF